MALLGLSGCLLVAVPPPEPREPKTCDEAECDGFGCEGNHCAEYCSDDGWDRSFPLCAEGYVCVGADRCELPCTPCSRNLGCNVLNDCNDQCFFDEECAGSRECCTADRIRAGDCREDFEGGCF